MWGPMIAFGTTILYVHALENPHKSGVLIFIAIAIIVHELYTIGERFGAIATTNSQKVEGHYLAWLVAWVVLLAGAAFMPFLRRLCAALVVLPFA